jgi:DNA-directed RNA polymerase II subunit RPB2
LKFGQIYFSKPSITEGDGSVQPIFPNEARLRNITYSAPLYVDVHTTVIENDEEQEEVAQKLILGRVCYLFVVLLSD